MAVCESFVFISDILLERPGGPCAEAGTAANDHPNALNANAAPTRGADPEHLRQPPLWLFRSRPVEFAKSDCRAEGQAITTPRPRAVAPAYCSLATAQPRAARPQRRCGGQNATCVRGFGFAIASAVPPPAASLQCSGPHWASRPGIGPHSMGGVARRSLCQPRRRTQDV